MRFADILLQNKVSRNRGEEAEQSFLRPLGQPGGLENIGDFSGYRVRPPRWARAVSRMPGSWHPTL